MESNEDADERGFTIVDKRGREEEAPPEPVAPAPEAAELPKVDFASFLISLGTSAL